MNVEEDLVTNWQAVHYRMQRGAHCSKRGPQKQLNYLSELEQVLVLGLVPALLQGVEPEFELAKPMQEINDSHCLITAAAERY